MPRTMLHIPSPRRKPKSDSNDSHEVSPSKKVKKQKIKNFFKRCKEEKKTIKCEQCDITHDDIERNKYCSNCGHCLWIQTEHKSSIETEADTTLKKQLVTCTTQRYHTVSEYHNQCKAIDKMIIQFVQNKINIEQQYIDSNKLLITKCSDQNKQNDDDFTSTIQQIMCTYIETTEEAVREHQNYLLFLKETEEYLQTQNEIMLDFINEFKEDHDEQLQKVLEKWKDIEYLYDSEKINDTQYKDNKSALWDEWQAFLSDSLQSFPIFMKMRYKKIAHKVLEQIIQNQMGIYDKIHSNCLNLWRIIHETINEHTEMHLFIQYHDDSEVDTLESLIQSLGFETKRTRNDDHDDGEDNNNKISKPYGDIMLRTRANGIEWFSPLIFSAKGAKKWNLDTNEWNLIIFEQLLCETFISNRRWNNKEQLIHYAPINCVRGQFEISKKRMNHLVDILMIDPNEYKSIQKYKLTSLCHRIEVIEHASVSEHFDGNAEEFIKFIHRQLSFMLSCMVWYILESQRNFWDVSGSKHNKSDLVQSLHTNISLVEDYCKMKANQSDQQKQIAAFSPVSHLMLMLQEIAEGINDENITIPNYVPIPNAVYQKMYIQVMNHSFIEKPNDILGELDLSSDSDDDDDRPKRSELHEGWTHIADLLFVLSKKSFMISVNFHCAAFLELIFDEILKIDEEKEHGIIIEINPLKLLRPNTDKKDHNLLQIIEKTFMILMDDANDSKRNEMNKCQEDMYLDQIIDKIENKLTNWCNDYRYCNAYSVAKFFLFYIFIKKIKNKDVNFICYDKLSEFTLITATQLSNELKNRYCGPNEELSTKLDSIHNFNKFRVDFLKILHDEMKWHSKLDQYLTESIDAINTIPNKNAIDEDDTLTFIVIDEFKNNHTETFLLQWMSRFSALVNDKLQQLKHQDINQDFLSFIQEINSFILITNQYRDKVCIQNRKKWYSVLPPLNKICVHKFKQWVKGEIDPIFKRCVDSLTKNEEWGFESNKRRRKSSLLLYKMSRHSLMSDVINDKLMAQSARESLVENTSYISDEIIDLCALIDSMTNGCLSFLISLKLYNFTDSKSYWKVLQKQLNRVCNWVTNNIELQISQLIPPIAVLSRNVINIEAFQATKAQSRAQAVLGLMKIKKKKDNVNDDETEEDSFNKQQEIRAQRQQQAEKLKQLAIKMHSLDFILSSLDKTKLYIEEQYTKFIKNELKDDAAQYLEREVEIVLQNQNVCKFLFENFKFIALTYDENGAAKDGLIVSLVKNQIIEYTYDVSIGCQLVKIGDKNVRNEPFEDILERIHDDYDELMQDKITLKFQFNVNGVVRTLFSGIYENYNRSLKKIGSLLSCEIIYNNLSEDLFTKLYHAPLDQNRFSDLNISNKLFKICDPIFDFLNDKNFGFIIGDIFDNLTYCICYILTQTKSVSTKEWIRNDFGLIRDDIHYAIKTFEDDIDEDHMLQKCVRIDAILEMIKCSTTHLTQHMLPLLQNYNACCENNHVLFECMVEPHKMLQKSNKKKHEENKNEDESEESQTEEEAETIIQCIKCGLFINIRHKLNDIGFYACGHEMCLKRNAFYCGKCCNELLWTQNTKTNVSKWDLVSMLNKKKENGNNNQSKQFAIKFAQNQCIRTQITMTCEQKETMLQNKKKKKQKKKR